MTSTARTPNWNEGLSARSTITGKNEYLLSTNGSLNTTGGGGGGGDVNIAEIAGVATVTGHGTAAGALRVELPTDGTGVVLLGANSGIDVGDVTINNSTGASAVNIQDGGNSITVDQATGTNLHTVIDSGSITSIVPGTTATSLGKAEDAAHTSGDVGIFALAVRNSAGAALTDADMDYSPIGVDSTGAIRVAGIAGAIIPGTGATSLGKAEDAAHTTGDTGVFSLGVRNDTLADTTNTTADYSQISTDLKGRVMTAGAPRALKGTAQVSLSNTTTETTIISATASTFHDVYGLILANTGATTTKVSIRDDTAGTVRAIIEVPTLETRGFMLPVDSAMPQTAVNKNWTAQCASATTALEVTALYVSMV